MAKEPIYIPYGDNEIELSALMTAIANNASNYVSSLPWSNKRKEKFLSAYQDIISKGIKGASNSSGQWALDLNEDIDLDSKSKKDLEMYHEAAYYILNLMQGLPTRQVVEEKAKNDLQLYNNDWHKKAFEGYIGNKMFGGRDWDYTKDWDTLDTRDSKTGILSTSGRMAKLAEMLEGYGNSLEENKYNFEGTAFKDLNDLKTRIGNAVNSLRSGVLDLNVKDSLNAVGLDWREFLRDGSEEVVGTDNNGNPITRAQAIEAQNLVQQEADAQKAAQEQQLALAKLKANAGVLNLIGGIHAVEARSAAPAYADYLSRQYGVGLLGYLAINNTVQGLLEKGRIGQLSSREKKQLGNLLYYIRTNNPNYKKSNISDAEWAELNKYSNLKSLNRNGFVRLPWQTSDGRYTFADDRGNIYYLKPLNKLKLGEIKINRNNINNYKNNFLKSLNNIALNKTIGENGGLTDDMTADLTAMGLDLVSAGTAFVPVYGTAASAVTGIGATISGAVADRMRGESWGSTLGTAGFGLSMDILGLIPGAGVGAKAAKIAKVVSKGAKWIGPILGGMAAMAYGPGAISAFNKFTSGKVKDISAEELRDFTYAMRAVAAGGIRKAGATYLNNRTLARAIKNGKAEISTGKQAASITTKNGQEIKLTDDEFKTLKSNASRESKAKVITKAAQREKINMEGDEIKWKGINPVKGRFKTSSKSSKVSGLKLPVEKSQVKWNTTSDDYKGIKRFSNENLLRNYMNMSGPSSGIWKSIRDRWTGKDILNRPLTLSSTIPATKESQKLLPFIKGKYNAPKTESLKIIPISRALPQPGGIHKGNVIDNSRPGIINSNKITLGDANLEFNDFHRMYIASTRKNSKVPSKPFGNGYGTSKEPENGSLSFNGMTATLTKLDNDKGFSITFGKSGDTAITQQYKDILQLRSEFAKQLNKVIKKQNNVKETAALLRQFKAKGWLKQGGQIQPNIETQIANFLRKR